MRVRNMASNSGREVPNQFIVESNDGRYFQSYDSVIAKIDHNGKVFLDNHYWDYSKTTSKYRNIFLGETTKDTKKKIDSGEYTLVNLNGGKV